MGSSEIENQIEELLARFDLTSDAGNRFRHTRGDETEDRADSGAHARA